MEPKVLFGLLQTRLRDYAAKHDPHILCDFVGIVPGTVQTWANGTHPAQGVNLIRLWHFLSAAGYESPELDELHPYTKYVGELLAYSIIPLEEASQLFGVRTVQSTHQHLRGMHVAACPAFGLDELTALYDEQLQKEKQKLREQLAEATDPQGTAAMARGPSPEVPAAVSQADAASTVTVPPAGIQFARSKEATIVTLATLLSTAAPLARYLDSDRCTPADRSYFRDLMGDGGVFELSNILNALCSERARTDMRGR